MVQQYKLNGHKAPVTCLAHSSVIPNARTLRTTTRGQQQQPPNIHSSGVAPCCLLSGSEDGSIRLWDLRSNPPRTSLCMLTPDRQEVTSVAFHPIATNDDDVESSDLAGQKFSYPFTVYCSVGNSVYGYDLRNTSSPILRDFDFHVGALDGGEEINQIGIFTHSHQGKKRVYFASADDDGRARVTDHVPRRRSLSQSSSTPQCTVLQHDTNGTGLVTTLAFRPKAKTLDLATGGTDCTVCLWDVHRPKRPSSSLVIQREEEEGVNQICNPPFVNSLSWSPSGRLLSAGLGDGTAVVMEVDGRKLVEKCRLRGGHDAAVASVLFPQFGGVSSKHVVAEDRLMVTGGNDGSIFLWDLGSKLASLGVDPSTMFVDCQSSNNSSGGGDGNTAQVLDDTLKNLSLSSKATTTPDKGRDPSILFGVRHGLKPNFMESSRTSDVAFPSSIFVADTSHDITVYTFPRL